MGVMPTSGFSVSAVPPPTNPARSVPPRTGFSPPPPAGEREVPTPPRARWGGTSASSTRHGRPRGAVTCRGQRPPLHGGRCPCRGDGRRAVWLRKSLARGSPNPPDQMVIQEHAGLLSHTDVRSRSGGPDRFASRPWAGQVRRREWADGAPTH